MAQHRQHRTRQVRPPAPQGQNDHASTDARHPPELSNHGTDLLRRNSEVLLDVPPYHSRALSFRHRRLKFILLISLVAFANAAIADHQVKRWQPWIALTTCYGVAYSFRISAVPPRRYVQFRATNVGAEPVASISAPYLVRTDPRPNDRKVYAYIKAGLAPLGGYVGWWRPSDGPHLSAIRDVQVHPVSGVTHQLVGVGIEDIYVLTKSRYDKVIAKLPRSSYWSMQNDALGCPGPFELPLRVTVRDKNGKSFMQEFQFSSQTLRVTQTPEDQRSTTFEVPVSKIAPTKFQLIKGPFPDTWLVRVTCVGGFVRKTGPLFDKDITDSVAFFDIIFTARNQAKSFMMAFGWKQR